MTEETATTMNASRKKDIPESLFFFNFSGAVLTSPFSLALSEGKIKLFVFIFLFYVALEIISAHRRQTISRYHYENTPLQYTNIF